jgi:hypothetical protein
MPLPEIAGVTRATATGAVVGGSRWSNTWHFRRSDLASPTGLEIAALHAILLAFYAGVISPQMPVGSTVDHMDYTPLDGTSGAIELPAGPLLGTEGGSMPAEVAEVLTIRTAARGRRARGRIYFPAFGAASFAADGHIGSGVIAGIVAAAAVMQAAAVAIGWSNGVASYGLSVKLDRTVRPARRVETTWVPFFTDVSLYTMDGVADVIRNRKG